MWMNSNAKEYLSCLETQMGHQWPMANSIVDLKFNYPSIEKEAQVISEYFKSQADSIHSKLFFPPYQGNESSLVIARRWLGAPDDSKIVLCNSGNHALICILDALRTSINGIITDKFVYPTFKHISKINGLEVYSARGDEYGPTIEGIEETRRRTGANVLYLQPTIHNPTCYTMSHERRTKIAGFAKENNLVIIEDDAYRFLHENPPPSFLEILPTNTFHIYSLSKPFNPLIKTTYLAHPSEWTNRLIDMIRVTSSGCSNLLTGLADYVIESGNLSSIITAKRIYAKDLQRKIRPLLKSLKYQTHESCFHLWLALPQHLTSEQIIQSLQEEGIGASPGTDFETEGSNEGQKYIRISLSAEKDWDTLERSIRTVANLAHG